MLVALSERPLPPEGDSVLHHTTVRVCEPTVARCAATIRLMLRPRVVNARARHIHTLLRWQKWVFWPLAKFAADLAPYRKTYHTSGGCNLGGGSSPGHRWGGQMAQKHDIWQEVVPGTDCWLASAQFRGEGLSRTQLATHVLPDFAWAFLAHFESPPLPMLRWALRHRKACVGLRVRLGGFLHEREYSCDKQRNVTSGG